MERTAQLAICVFVSITDLKSFILILLSRKFHQPGFNSGPDNGTLSFRRASKGTLTFRVGKSWNLAPAFHWDANSASLQIGRHFQQSYSCERVSIITCTILPKLKHIEQKTESIFLPEISCDCYSIQCSFSIYKNITWVVRH